ncbi:dynein axonemal assembly factor 8-like isoform X3 [Pseudophryne corroboree]|uniref:dynein axonemal assembly factor 8-like isoform X3 n=1 Tax=Pseudophryne corroboree TaxID=495146 RepID=UPI00308177C5
MDSKHIKEEAPTSQPTWTGVCNWESVLTTVSAPSLDSDEGSLSDCELEDVKIFQREDCSILDLPEELFYEEQECMNKVVAVPDTPPTGDYIVEKCSIKSQVTSDVSRLIPDSEASPTTSHLKTDAKPEDAARDVLSERKTEIKVDECDRLHRLKQSASNHFTAQNHVLEDRGSSDQHEIPLNGQLELEPIQLSMPSLKLTDQWDLNLLLQRLTEEGIVTEVKEPLSVLPIENSSRKRQDQVMEQLMELSVRQSQTVTPGQDLTEGRRILSHRPGLLQAETRLCLSNRHSENIPTVVIDLRPSSSNKSLKPGAETPTQDNLETKDLPQDRPEHTGKSILLRQLRHIKTPPCSNSPHHSAQKPTNSGCGHVDRTIPHQTRRIRRLRNRMNVSQGTPIIEEGKQEQEDGFTEQENTEEASKSSQDSPDKVQSNCSTDEQAPKDKQEKERRRRQSMHTQLDGMKPQNSVDGRQPMAEQTPVLFHPEASYCPEIDSLPVRSEGERLLLTVRLSSCGQVIIPGLHSSRCPVSALSMANTYHALLVWFLSLVSPLNPHSEGTAPFQVLGLQQVWREEGLALYVCISPHGVPVQSTPKARKHKGKDDHRGTSSFYQQTSLFLSHNTLHNITWWSEAVIQQLLGQLFPLNLDVSAIKLSSIVMLNPDPQAVEKVFSLSSGFFWQTLETEERLSPLSPDILMDSEMEVLPVTLFDTLLRDPVAFHHALHLILTAGLDVCGLRLLYPQASTQQLKIVSLPPFISGGDANNPPVLILVLRGHHASEIWGNISGPSDPQLARLTDPNSINALYGHTREDTLLYYPRTSGRIWRDLSLWFGGRIPSNGNLKIGIQNPPKKSTQPRSQSPTEKCLPPALLTATTRGDVFLAVSPVVPPCAIGDIIDTCCQRGFALHGVRNIRFSAKRAAMLNMSPSQLKVFCQNMPSTQPQLEPCTFIPGPRLHSLLLLLRKENAAHHTPALLHGLMNELAEQGLLGVIRTNLCHLGDLNPNLCFHAAPYSDSLLQGLGGNLHAVPDPSSVVLNLLSRQPFTTDPEVEQVVILTMSGVQTLLRAGQFLRQILRPQPRKQEENSAGSGVQSFEVLGVKWLPCLSRLQAKEITPYEVGDRPWQASVDQLTSTPALVCALRQVHAFTTLANAIRELVPTTGKLQAQLIMSATPEIAFRQAALIFTDWDLVSDPQSRSVLKYIAPPGIHCQPAGGGDHRGQTESIFGYMLLGPPLLYTVLILKPGGWSRNLGKILHKIGMQRFVLVGLKLVTLTTEDSLNIIPPEVKQNKVLCQSHCDYLTSAPCLILCLRRPNSILRLLELMGPDEPHQCKAQDQFLWRAQYGLSAVQNGMYVSDWGMKAQQGDAAVGTSDVRWGEAGSTSYQAAVRDIKHFFPEGLICDQQSVVLEAEQISRLTQDVLFSSRTQRQTRKTLLCQQGQSQRIDLPFTSALCQTTCLLFPSRTLGGSSPTYIQGLEQLIDKAFLVTGARLTVFDQSQAQIVAELYSLKNSLSAEFKVLIEGPCLVIAAQRDNAVTCFHSLMGSDNLQNGQNFVELVLSPQTQAQADKMISCFFDSLTPDSIHQIVPRAS